MSEISIILPNQLFFPNPIIQKNRNHYLIECNRYFTDFLFHKKKLLFHRASMQKYLRELDELGYSVEYVESGEYKSITDFIENLLLHSAESKNLVLEIHIISLIDHQLQDEFENIAKKDNIRLNFHPSPAFLTPKEWYLEFFKPQKKKSTTTPKYFMKKFYKMQRKRMNILIDEKEKPVGGKWSYDRENRKKLPKSIKLPEKLILRRDLEEDIEYIEEKFKNNPGDTLNFFYPITHTEAKEWFTDFLQNKINLFGPYEDAISENHDLLFHSILSPLLNSGLLTPKYVVESILEFAEKTSINLASLEGFLRQIIGWREFIRIVYELEGRVQRNSNYFEYAKPLPKSLYTASTGMTPVDNVINKVLKNAYCHHIERLMVLGNFLVLTEISPNEVYRWFMEMFIDAYDWVMVPNVYGMSQFADGGLMSTKPYVSSSNYLLKMSDFPKGDWCEIFDALYWSFIYTQKEKFEKNPRMGLMLKLLEKKEEKKLKKILKISQQFKKELNLDISM